MVKYLLLLLVCLYTLGGTGQIPWEQWGKRDSLRARFLMELKEGALLFRLPDPQLVRKALRERGRWEEWEKRERQLQKEETIIRRTFATQFDYCPVFFFRSRFSDSVRQGQLEGILSRANGDTLEREELPESFYVAEFGETPRLGIKGLVLLRAELNPLREPLPFYERRQRWLGLVNLSKAEMIVKYNERLETAYRQYFED